MSAYQAAGDRGSTVPRIPAPAPRGSRRTWRCPWPASYRFVVSCQHAGTSVQLRFDHLSDALLLVTTAADGEQTGAATDLVPGTTYHLTMEAAGTAGGAVDVLVLGENLPQGPLDRLVCHPAESVERVRRANVLLDKALRIATAAGLTEPELRHMLTHPADFGGLALTALPVTADEDDPAAATVLFGQVGRLLDYVALRAAIGAVPGELTDLFAHARQTYPADPASRPARRSAAADQARQAAADALLADVQARVAALTRRDQPVVAEAFGQLGITATVTAQRHGARRRRAGAGTSEVGLGRLWTVLALATRTGTSPGALADGTPIPDMTVARQLRDAVRAGYDADGWRQVAQPIFDTLRQRRRDALVAWIMQHDGFTEPDDLYEYFLVDPATEPVVQTSRLRLAISAVQLFIQRCLLNLEPACRLADRRRPVGVDEAVPPVGGEPEDLPVPGELAGPGVPRRQEPPLRRAGKHPARRRRHRRPGQRGAVRLPARAGAAGAAGRPFGPPGTRHRPGRQHPARRRADLRRAVLLLLPHLPVRGVDAVGAGDRTDRR